VTRRASGRRRETGTEPFPSLILPMMAVLGPLPQPPEAFGAELKWDGVRAIAHVRDGTVRLVSRNGRDVSASYPDLAELGQLLASQAVVLDGEIVAFDQAGRPNFGTLQSRMHVAHPSPRLLATVPVFYHLFDLLHLNGRSALTLPYQQRRDLLDDLQLDAPRIQVPPYLPGGGEQMLATARERGLEGVVSKRLDSPYLPGRRSDLWRKTKITAMQEVVIGGWKPGAGRRAGMIGSLLLGVPDQRGLRFAGGVGTGFTEAMLRDLARRLRPLARRTSPFADEIPRPDARDATWVEPRLVAEVEFTGWTSDGHLRHPSWRGLRSDKSPHEVERELSQ
jgi:bifunctional non-homologous end joining protein LigD